MRRYWIGLLAVVFAGFFAVSGSVMAQSPTPTPTQTPTITPTLTNLQRMGMATIAPPRICGSAYVPCGPAPFRGVQFPTVVLPSPTLIWSANLPATPGAGTPTWTPTPTSTPLIDAGPISTLSGAVSEIALTMGAPSTQVVNIGGTPVGVFEISEQFGSNVAAPFTFVRAIQEATGNLGLIGALINFLFISVVFGVLVHFATLFLPAIFSIVRFVINVIGAIKPF